MPIEVRKKQDMIEINKTMPMIEVKTMRHDAQYSSDLQKLPARIL